VYNKGSQKQITCKD